MQIFSFTHFSGKAFTVIQFICPFYWKVNTTSYNVVLIKIMETTSWPLYVYDAITQ